MYILQHQKSTNIALNHFGIIYTLQNLWNKLCIKETEYLKHNRYNRVKGRQEFKAAQSLFDKEYRKAKRSFRRNKVIQIENMSGKDPKQFREAINKLGPRKPSTIPMEIYDDTGNVLSDINSVLPQWEVQYKYLDNIILSGKFEDEFHKDVKENI